MPVDNYKTGVGREKARKEVGTAGGTRRLTESSSGTTSSWNYISKGIKIRLMSLINTPLFLHIKISLLVMFGTTRKNGHIILSVVLEEL